MAHVSRPLIGLLLATVAFFALWLVALKPKGSSGGGSSKAALGQYQSAINAAHGAVQTSNADNARAGADPTTPATTPAPVATAPAHASAGGPVAARAAARHAVSPVHTKVSRRAAVQQALHSHKVLALLFYNPAGADDQAVRQELGAISLHGGKVFKLAVPLSEIDGYLAITAQVPVNVSPTLVLIAPNGQAGEIVGYADPFEVSQRVDDALALR